MLQQGECHRWSKLRSDSRHTRLRSPHPGVWSSGARKRTVANDWRWPGKGCWGESGGVPRLGRSPADLRRLRVRHQIARWPTSSQALLRVRGRPLARCRISQGRERRPQAALLHAGPESQKLVLERDLRRSLARRHDFYCHGLRRNAPPPQFRRFGPLNTALHRRCPRATCTPYGRAN